MFRGGSEDNKILEYEAVKLPESLYAPVPPADMSTEPMECTWKVALYKLSQDSGEFDIEAFYDFVNVRVP